MGPSGKEIDVPRNLAKKATTPKRSVAAGPGRPGGLGTHHAPLLQSRDAAARRHKEGTRLAATGHAKASGLTSPADTLKPGCVALADQVPHHARFSSYVPMSVGPGKDLEIFTGFGQEVLGVPPESVKAQPMSSDKFHNAATPKY